MAYFAHNSSRKTARFTNSQVPIHRLHGGPEMSTRNTDFKHDPGALQVSRQHVILSIATNLPPTYLNLRRFAAWMSEIPSRSGVFLLKVTHICHRELFTYFPANTNTRAHEKLKSSAVKLYKHPNRARYSHGPANSSPPGT